MYNNQDKIRNIFTCVRNITEKLSDNTYFRCIDKTLGRMTMNTATRIRKRAAPNMFNTLDLVMVMMTIPMLGLHLLL
jgi:hypothetical protein